MTSTRNNKSRSQEKKKNKLRGPMKKTDDVSRPFFPSDLIIEVLSRLPVDSLIRFQCVSKQWVTLLSNPSFINVHTRRSHSKPSLMFCGKDKPNTLIFFDVERMEKKILPFRPKKDCNDENNITIHASYKGLVLLKSEECYYIYNPVTRFCMTVPPPPEGCGAFNLLSLAYDSTNMKFKLVCGMKRMSNYMCCIFTIGTDDDSWRECVIPSPHRLFNFPPVSANGFLHWMIHSNEIENMENTWTSEPESEGYILTMDVGREIFYKTGHPECLSGVYTLLEMNGRLCFTDHVSNTQLKFWLLKDLEKQEWIEEFSVQIRKGDEEFEEFEGFLVDCYPIAIIGNEGKYKIIIKCNKDLFFSYDVGAGDLTVLEIDHFISFKSEFEEMYSPIKHTNSLLGGFA